MADLSDNIKNWVSNQVNNFVHSETFISWAQNEAAPTVKKDLEKFLKDPSIANKIHEYQQDPEKLEEDFLKYTGYLDKVDTIFTVLDIATIVAMAISALGSFGGTAAVGAGVRALVRQTIKEGMRSVAKTIFRRALATTSAGVLKRYALLGVGRFSAGIIREIGWRVAIHAALSSVIAGLQAGSIAALVAAKDAVLNHGTDLGMPLSLIQEVTKPEVNASVFKSIIDNYLQGLQDYTLKLVTTKTGLMHVTMGGLARAVGVNKLASYMHFSQGYRQSYAAAKAGTLTAATYAKTYGLRHQLHSVHELAKDKTDQLQNLKEKRKNKNTDTEIDIEDVIKKSSLPTLLHRNYERTLRDIIFDKDAKQAQKLVDNKIRVANYRIAEAVEILQELAILDVIQRHQRSLAVSANEEIFNELLEDIIDTSGTNAYALMQSMGVESIDQLVAALRESKTTELDGLLDALALGDENLNALQDALKKTYRIAQFKEALNDQTQTVIMKQQKAK